MGFIISQQLLLSSQDSINVGYLYIKIGCGKVNMMRFRFLPHTADMAFIGYGKSFREALENAALALLSIRMDAKKIRRGKGKSAAMPVTAAAHGYEDLVWYSLQDILSKVDARSLPAYGFRVKELEEGKGGLVKMRGEILYKRAKEGADYYLLDVKAVTPHELYVKKRGGRYAIHVVVDI